MYKLEDLFRMVPEGNWTVNEDHSLVDPNGNTIKLGSDLSPVNKKLYRKF